MSEPEAAAPAPSLGALALLFVRLGATAFGGPAAHVAMMEREIVQKRRWVAPERFLDLFGAASLIPGPSSSELAVYLGYEKRGVAGLIVAGLCFVLPAASMTGALAWVYVRFGTLPQASGVLYGIKPVIIAIVAQAIWSLGPKAIKTWLLAGIGALAAAAAAFGVESIFVLLGAGLLATLARAGSRPDDAGPRLFAFGVVGVGVEAARQPTLSGLLFLFLKFGAVVFGSGYVLLAFLRADLVDRLHWLSEAQLIDAVAVGQVTPGPVFTTATFIGYLLGGWPGAVVATLAIFLPGFVLVGATRPIVTRLRRSPITAAFLDGVNAASLALMAVVTVELGRAAMVDAATIVVAMASAVLLVRWRLNSAWLVLGGAAVGAAVRTFG